MAYHVYNTLGLILGGASSGEANRFHYIFTRDLGLVGAHGQNTRSTGSKLRYSLDAPARSQVSLVRGKNMWRLISATSDKRYYSIFSAQPESLHLCVRVFSLLKQLLPGEEANPALFDLVNSFLNFLEENLSGLSNATAPEISLKNLEVILMLRMLHILGYLPEHQITQTFARDVDWSFELIASMAPYQKEAIKMVNESLRATGL